MEAVSIGQRIRSRRRELGLTAEEVVERMKVRGVLPERKSFSISHLSRMERGRSGDLKIDDLKAVAAALDTTYMLLIGGDNPHLEDALQVFIHHPNVSNSLSNIANFFRGASVYDRENIERILTDFSSLLSRPDIDLDSVMLIIHAR